MADLYATLGVPQNASDDEIKRAYRRKARESHPDAGGDAETFKQVTHAYQVLSDPSKRQRYDRFGDDGTPSTRAGQGDPFGFGAGFGGIGDVIDAFFGNAFQQGAGRTSARSRSGRDVLVPADVTLAEVASGVRRQVAVDVAVMCDRCGGSGSESGRAPSACATCGGTGSVQRIVRTAFGQVASAQACPTCHGTGRAIADPCSGCGGEGRRVQNRQVTVEIPPGVATGDRLRVAGAGEAGRNGAAAGDLFVEVRVQPDGLFERDGRHLHATVTVPFVQAALGADLAVPTVDGDRASVRLPAGTQPGDVVTARRHGLPPRGGGTRGDLLLHVQVEVPRDLDDGQRQLLRELADLRGEDTATDDGGGLFTRLREAFRS